MNKKKQSIAQEAFAGFDKAWGYVGKSILASRHLLNAGLRSCRWILWFNNPQVNQKIQALVARLKLFSFVGIPLNLAGIPSLAQKVSSQYKFQDHEGIALSFLTLSIVITDVLDSFATFVSGIIQTFSLHPIGGISAVGTPLAALVIGLGSISRTTRLIHLGQFQREINQLILQLEGASLEKSNALIREFLQKKLKTPPNEDPLQKTQIDERKKAVLERRLNHKAASLLISLTEIFDAKTSINENEKKFLLDGIKEVKSIVRKEMKVQGGYLSTNLLNAIALILFFVLVLAALPFLLLAISMIARIAISAYQDLHRSY